MNGNGKMTIEYWETEKLRDAAYNSKMRTTEQAIKGLKNSIEALGVLQPLAVAPSGILIDGHRRLTCAKRLGIEQLPVIVHDVSDQEAGILYKAMNGDTRRMKPYEWLTVYKYGVEVPGNIGMQIRRLDEALGDGGIDWMIENRVSPSVYNRANNLCALLGSDALLGKAVRWIIENKMQYILEIAFRDGMPTEVFHEAIDRNVRVERLTRWEREGRKHVQRVVYRTEEHPDVSDAQELAA
jgi:hypothetical protein